MSGAKNPTCSVSGQQSDGGRSKTHNRDRQDESVFPSNEIPHPTENNRSEGPNSESCRKDCKRREESNDRISSWKELR